MTNEPNRQVFVCLFFKQIKLQDHLLLALTGTYYILTLKRIFFFLSGNQNPHMHKMSLCPQIDQNGLPFLKFPKSPTLDTFPPT